MKLAVRKSKTHGRGAFALQTIRKGERVIEYTGERISEAEYERRAQKDADTAHTFFFGLSNGTVIDPARGGNASRYINHSCSPNCETEEDDDRVFVVALKAIRPGEELTYDYQLQYSGRITKKVQKEHPCYCGAPNCKGTLFPRRTRTSKKKKS